MIDRRRFLQSSAMAVAALGGGLAATRTALGRTVAARPGTGRARSPSETTPIRPPAVPLIVRSPYLSTWQSSTVSPGGWQTFWNGDVTALAGIVRVDGVPFVFAGEPDIGENGAAFQQTHLALTATRSVFTLQGQGVRLTLEYLSPIEPGDLQRQSIPMAWVLVTARSIDGASHDVSVYLDISGEWLSGDPSQRFTWAPVSVPYHGGALQAWTLQLAEQRVLTELGDRAQWGTIVLATPQIPGLSYQSGPSFTVRRQFAEHGALLDTDDTSYTSIGGDSFPSFGFALAFGQVGSQPRTGQFSLGHVRTPLVSYLGEPLQPLWTDYFKNWQRMLAFFHSDIDGARSRASALDAKVSADARKAGGAEYEALCVLSLRQAYGATELALGPDRTPWAFLKEISSNGDMATVDVIFPASPVWIYLDPHYLSLLLKPTFAYAASERWTARFAPHDVGIYPRGFGWEHVLAETMPVEESGNMIIMAAAYTLAAPGTTALVYLQANYRWLKRWADYLVATLPDPGLQNQTDDFAGRIAHSVNLSLKGIVAVAAMGQIAHLCGERTDAAHYRSKAKQFIAYWLKHAPARGHLGLTYRRRGRRHRGWGTLYNAYPDALLHTGLVPASLAAEQAAFYRTKMNRLGLPLQTPRTYAKTDWQMWVAAWLHDHPVRRELIGSVYRYANTTTTRVPFSDLYSTTNAEAIFTPPFEARPTQGGVFALLALHALEGRRA